MADGSGPTRIGIAHRPRLRIDLDHGAGEIVQDPHAPVAGRDVFEVAAHVDPADDRAVCRIDLDHLVPELVQRPQRSRPERELVG